MALWCFKSIGKDLSQTKVKYNSYGIACWTVEQANYLITNEDVQTDKNYHFGVNVENVGNIRKSIGRSNPQQLYKIIKNLLEEYILRVDYNHSIDHSLYITLLLIKQIDDIDIKDIE